MYAEILEKLSQTAQTSVSNDISNNRGTFWRDIFLVLYRKELTYEMLSDIIDGYKCTLLVGHLLLVAGFIIEIQRIKCLEILLFYR